MINFKVFKKHSDYEAFVVGDEYVEPHVSFCEDVEDVQYNLKTKPEPEPSEYYLTNYGLLYGPGQAKYWYNSSVSEHVLTPEDYNAFVDFINKYNIVKYDFVDENGTRQTGNLWQIPEYWEDQAKPNPYLLINFAYHRRKYSYNGEAVTPERDTYKGYPKEPAQFTDIDDNFIFLPSGLFTEDGTPLSEIPVTKEEYNKWNYVIPEPEPENPEPENSIISFYGYGEENMNIDGVTYHCFVANNQFSTDTALWVADPDYYNLVLGPQSLNIYVYSPDFTQMTFFVTYTPGDPDKITIDFDNQ